MICVNIAVCDDSSLDRKLITDLLKDYFSGKSVSYDVIEYENADALIYEIEDGKFFDIVFLDIYMDGMLGMDAARRMREIGYENDIIFLTASSDYAVDSYDVKASGYLLKPHSFEKLKMVMDRIVKSFDEDVYPVKHRSSIIRVPLNDITFVESINSKCIVHTVGGKEYPVYKRLGDIEQELNDSRFLRCHRSFLVNMNYIVGVDKQFELSTGEIVLIRQKSLKDIKEQYFKYTGER